MQPVGFLIAGALGLTAWLYFRRMPAATGVSGPSGAFEPSVGAPIPAAPLLDPVKLSAANAAAAQRLWKYGYGSPPHGKSTERMDALVRGNVNAILQVDTLDHKYFPRRPALMSELMRALEDPGTASAKLSRMIAHDPVLTGDVLRLANSSLYRVSAAPIDTIQRAIAVCGVDALRSILATAMLRPVFRANSRNFPRLPRTLWNRTQLAARAAERHAMVSSAELRFESQMVVLLNAIGPLVVYGAVVDVYARNPLFKPNPELCVSLTSDLAPQLALRIARDWEMAPRLVTALDTLDTSAEDALKLTLAVGELLGTLFYLESQTVISGDERARLIESAGLTPDLVKLVGDSLQRNR